MPDLNDRATKCSDAYKKSKERLAQVTENMMIVQKTCEDDLKVKLSRAQDTNQEIISRLTVVFGKFEKLISELDRGNPDKGKLDDLVCAQRDILGEFKDP